MVYGPGGYKFTDYLRFGIPLNLIVCAVTLVVTPIVYPF
jgi:di/tricarboxylate transporter